MSFAVIQTGGKQYKVSASEILKIERLDDKEGKTVEFKNVLFLNDDKTTEIGSPNIQGAKVEATILKNTKIYCGHEYTYKNAEFCIRYDSDNVDLKKKFEQIKN